MVAKKHVNFTLYLNCLSCALLGFAGGTDTKCFETNCIKHSQHLTSCAL